jgi:sugar phosphate isomerase/epimerase
MDLLFAAPRWPVMDLSPADFCARAVSAGFDAVEVFGETMRDEAAWRDVLDTHGLALVGAVWTPPGSPAEHLRSLDEQLARLVRLGAALANVQLGSDLFEAEDAAALVADALACAAGHGLPMVVETHRSRPTFSAPTTARLLRAVPEVWLCADLSHWMVVHESDTLDEVAAHVDAALARTAHVHARIGFSQGPQVPDWRAPEWSGHVERYVGWWQRVVDARATAGAERLVITPEFGPPPYAPTRPGTGQPLADVWELNVALRERLARDLHVPAAG